MGKRRRLVATRRANEAAPAGPLEAPKPQVRGVGGGEPAKPADRPTPAQPALRAAASALRAAQRRRIAADRDTALAVRRLRELGASWHQVGLLLGVTAEGARRRYRLKK